MTKIASHTMAGKLLAEIGVREEFCISTSHVKNIGTRHKKSAQEIETVVVLVQTTGDALHDVHTQVPPDNPWSLNIGKMRRSQWYRVKTARLVRAAIACHNHSP